MNPCRLASRSFDGKGKSITAIEVKSDSESGVLSGMDGFSRKFNPRRMVRVDAGGIELKQLLGNGIGKWIE